MKLGKVLFARSIKPEIILGHFWELARSPQTEPVGHQNAITDQNQAVGAVPFYLLLGVPR